MDPLIKDHISKIPLFSGVEHSELLPLLQDCEVKEFKPGEYFCRYGEYSENSGIILSGSTNVKLPQKGVEHTDKKIILQEGEILGEIAALSGNPRTADVVALQTTKILIVSRETLFKLIDKFPSIKNEIDKRYRQRVLNYQLFTIPIFAGVPRKLLEDILNKVTLHSYRKGEIVFHQGDEADAFYLVRYGFVKGTEVGSDGKERVLAYLKRGHYFGEMALIKEGKKRMATITAINRSELIRISREDFLSIIESYPRVKAGLEKAIEKREERNVQIREDECVERTLNAIIDSGVIQTKAILIIDTTKCIQCDNCVKACAALHNNQTRLVRKGTKINNIFLVATSCRHCDDPTCMIKCPTGAIARDFAGEIYHRDSCIGCGKCVQNCPYGNISIITLPETNGEKDFSQGFLTRCFKKLGKGNRQQDKELSVFEKAHESKKLRKKSVMCDMCREHSFIGCVYNCPTGATRRVDPTEFFADITTVG